MATVIEDDDSIFITQNTFRNNIDSDLEDNVDAFLDIFDNDKNITQVLNENVEFSDENEDILLHASQMAEDQNNNVDKSGLVQNKSPLIYRPVTEPITDSEDEVPPKQNRFHFVSEEQVRKNSQKRYAGSTETKIKWALQLFRSWKKSRNSAAASHNFSVIVPDLEEMTVDELNYSLSRFIQEIRKENHEEYPGKTLKEIVLSIQMHLSCIKNSSMKFLEDSNFTELKNTLDNIMKTRAHSGIGTKRKQAEVITLEEEQGLWDCGALGTQDPETLLHTVFYLFGLHFALRGGQEHQDLRVGLNSQFTLHTDSDGRKYLQYQEDSSKCHTGGLNHYNVPRKNVKAYENMENEKRCVVKLYELYLSHCPVPRPDAFYLRPLLKPTSNVWYGRQPVGYHKLRCIVKDICHKGKLCGYRTNHSLRATAASRLYAQGIDEQVIQEVTGHRSVAVRSYKRTPASLKRKVSAILSGNTSATTTSTSNTININSNDFKTLDCGEFCNSEKKPNATIVVNVNI